MTEPERPPIPTEWPVCEKCGEVHARWHVPAGVGATKGAQPSWVRTCSAHVRYEWDETTRTRVRREAQRACLRWAATGADVCQKHGLNGDMKAKATRELSDRKARKLAARWAVPINTTPTEAVLDRIAAYAGHVAFYREMVEREGAVAMVYGQTRVKRTTGGEDEPRRETVSEAKRSIWLDLYNESSELLVKFSAEALRIGIEQARVRLAQQMGETFNALLRGILGDLKLTKAQRELVPEATVRHLRMLSGGSG